MERPLTCLDWSLVQVFLTVAQTGSLSEAARALGSSQPTVGRQVRQIEEELEATLFQRQPRGLRLTETGAALVPHAQAMHDSAHALGLVAAGRSDRLSGTVRITASVFTSQYQLPPIIARIRRLEPEIAIELVPSNESENLLYREADIALRMFRTEQLDIVTKRLGAFELGIYAAKDYLDRVGRPKRPEDLWTLDLVGYDRNDVILRGLRETGLDAQRDWFATRCDEHSVYWELVRAGCGVGFAQADVGDRDPDVERLFPGQPIPPLQLWIAAHEAIRRTPRIRRVWTLLEEGLKPHLV